MGSRATSREDLHVSAVCADEERMSQTLNAIMKLDVPFVVVLGERRVNVKTVRQWIPGSILELPINAEEELDVRINNRSIGKGSAVKIGENFGVRISSIVGKESRINAMGEDSSTPTSADPSGEMSPEEIAEALLSGQL
jgi:flagellar motor switch protein FliN/FliY